MGTVEREPVALLASARFNSAAQAVLAPGEGRDQPDPQTLLDAVETTLRAVVRVAR